MIKKIIILGNYKEQYVIFSYWLSQDSLFLLTMLYLFITQVIEDNE